MWCKLCGEDMSPDCVLHFGICVFCFYDTDSWDSNGQLVTRNHALLRGVKRTKPRVHLPANMRRILRHTLNCTIIAVGRRATETAIDVDLFAKVVSKCGFVVRRVDLKEVAGPEDAALRLARAVSREETDLDWVMQVYTHLQARHKMAIIVENFGDAVNTPGAKYIEGSMRSYAQGHRNATWLFLGTMDMFDAFIRTDRPFYQSGIVLWRRKWASSHEPSWG